MLQSWVSLLPKVSSSLNWSKYAENLKFKCFSFNPEANFKLALKEASRLPQAKKPILSALISAARLKLRIFSFKFLFSSFCYIDPNLYGHIH